MSKNKIISIKNNKNYKKIKTALIKIKYEDEAFEAFMKFITTLKLPKYYNKTDVIIAHDELIDMLDKIMEENDNNG